MTTRDIELRIFAFTNRCCPLTRPEVHGQHSILTCPPHPLRQDRSAPQHCTVPRVVASSEELAGEAQITALERTGLGLPTEDKETSGALMGEFELALSGTRSKPPSAWAACSRLYKTRLSAPPSLLSTITFPSPSAVLSVPPEISTQHIAARPPQLSPYDKLPPKL